LSPRGESAPVAARTSRYGPLESQEGDLYLPTLPNSPRPPVVCLLHGGFWRMPYGREELDPVARDLAARGFAVWNLEYRRLGAPLGGWPETFQDVAAGIDHLATLAAEGAALDPGRVIVAGHSAGGHLALWSVARGDRPDLLRRPARVRPIAAAGLAAIVDLATAFEQDAGRGAVGELLGGSPDTQPARYAAASPLALLPLGVDQLILHGTLDEALPVATARLYARAATAAGDRVQFTELPRAGHMDYLDPGSEAHATLCRWLETRAG
jgi:acetyl esterase/lipase